jgi:hypothetical protein
MKKLAIIVLSVATAFTGITPAQAFPAIARPDMPQVSNVEQVQYYRRYGDRYRYDRYRYRYGDDRWRHRRYHRHNNAGAIIGGLAAGVIIGSILNAQRQPRYYSGGSYHTRWCYSRYRSYRAYDNTYQPYYGPRRQCVSP